MQTWATLAAKHATLTSGIGLGVIPAAGWDSLDGVALGALLAGVGFAVLNSPRRAQSCPLPPTMYDRASQVQTSRSAAGRLARARQRVDGLLTGMLSDDSDQTTSAPPTWQGEAPAERTSAERTPAERTPAERTPAERTSAESAGPGLAAAQLMAAPTAADAEQQPSATAVDAENAPAPPATGERKSESGFWGPGEIGASAPTSGYRSKHRLDGPARNATPEESRRTGPRHAAPPASFGATLSRSLTSPRLTSRSAAHAGG